MPIKNHSGKIGPWEPELISHFGIKNELPDFR